MKRFLVVFAVIFAGVAFSQTAVTARQGQPGNQGPWPVSMGGSAQDGGAIVVQDAICYSPQESFITFDGGAASPVPPAATPVLALRRTVLVCSSVRNAGSPIWTIRNDGTAPTTTLGSAGQTLGIGDCIAYTIGATSTDGGVPIYAISDTNGAVLNVTECR